MTRSIKALLFVAIAALTALIMWNVAYKYEYSSVALPVTTCEYTDRTGDRTSATWKQNRVNLKGSDSWLSTPSFYSAERFESLTKKVYRDVKCHTSYTHFAFTYDYLRNGDLSLVNETKRFTQWLVKPEEKPIDLSMFE